MRKSLILRISGGRGVPPLIRPTRLLSRVGIHAATGFAAEASGLDVLHHERRGAEFFAKGFVQVFEDVQTRVQTHEVHHFEWAHGVIEANPN